ncbi:MAG: GspH/FimT family pseudopilin [Proteobacteria bacterium]|nr:GspH/FimT family pseudopilin [Pseudomonadota bacterium]
MKAQYQAGFSLLELLVALFVVVIITSLVTLAVNSGSADVEVEARAKSLVDISGFALDEAQMRGVDIGLLIERKEEGGDSLYSYGWRERTPQGWRRPVVDRDIFVDRQFPVGIELALELEETQLDILDGVERALENASAGGKLIEVTPQVIFYSSGEVTAGSMELRQIETNDLLWRIEWDLLGRFSLLRGGEIHDD